MQTDGKNKNVRKRWIIVSELYNVTSSPHIRAKDSTQKIMLYVIIALLPATVFGIINFGPRALAVVVVSIGRCLVSEYLYNIIAL